MPRKKKEEMPADDSGVLALAAGDEAGVAEDDGSGNVLDIESGDMENRKSETEENERGAIVPESGDGQSAAENESEPAGDEMSWNPDGLASHGDPRPGAGENTEREAQAPDCEKNLENSSEREEFGESAGLEKAVNAPAPEQLSELAQKAYSDGAGAGDPGCGEAGDGENAGRAGDSPSLDAPDATPPYAQAGIEAAPAPEKAPLMSKTPARPAPARKRTITGLDLNALDRGLSEEQMREWNAIYASYRAKSVLTGTAIGADEISFDMKDRDTGETARRRLGSLIVIEYRVKILIPESEMWMPGDERPGHVLRNMVGSQVDYVIMEVDREGECAIGSRRVAMAAKRHFFSKGDHREDELLKCRVMAVGAKQCTVECNGFDVRMTQRDLSYAAMADLREKYRPGQELSCLLKLYDPKEGRLEISVKEVNPNPFTGADRRHPIGSRRHAVISGKYGGGVFCTLPDDTVCLCLYSAQHSDVDFKNGDSVIIVIRQYDYARQLIYGRILAKW
jgi:hypothetical protein